MALRALRRQEEQGAEPLVLRDSLPYRISVVAEAVSHLFAARYEQRFGLSIPEWRVMAVVGEGAPQSTQAVIGRTGMDRVRVSRAVIRLADKGLLERAPHPRDQRAQMLALSSRGRAVYDEIIPLAREMQARLAEALTEAECAQLDRILAKLARRAEEMGG
jgi:DNA-binding MarR family transcriptional regulator